MTSSDLIFDDRLQQYIHALLVAANSPKYNSSPRGVNVDDETELAENAKANARSENRRFVIPVDIKKAAPDVLRRYVDEKAITAILDSTEVP